MNRKTQILLSTHLLALGLAYGVARNTEPTGKIEPNDAPARSKSQARERQSISGDGAELLEGFLREQAEKKSKYEELKATLPAAKDLKRAAADAIAALGGKGWHAGLTDEEWADRIAEAEVRVLHLMKRNPGETMDFLISDPASNESGFIYSLKEHVFKEVALENGVLRSMPWLTSNLVTLSTLCSVTLEEMKAGGGLALFTKMEAALVGNAHEAELRSAFLNQPRFMGSVGESTAFRDKEKLLELARQQPGGFLKAALLAGFGRSDERASAWLLDLIARGELEESLAMQVQSSLGEVVLNSPTMDLEQRVEARRATKGNETKPRQDIVNELVRGDIAHLLETGRDWRYEFRNGTASLDDVVAAVRTGLPGIPPEGEDAMRVTLFMELSEENPKKALRLLDELPEETRRDTLFNGTWQSQVNLSPDDFLRYLEQVPEPVSAQEKDFRTKGWNWKARGFLTRYGDDYVEWVKQMPPGLDKDTAMNSLIWATREQNPAEARKLNDQLYPKKP